VHLGHSYLALFSFPGLLGRFPDAISDFISFGYVDHNRKTTIVGNEERGSRYKPLNLRGCLKSLGCRESTEHQTRHREINHRRTALRQPFIIFAQAARLVEPSQCPFHYPTAGKEDKALTTVGT